MSQQKFKEHLQALYQEGWVAGMHRKCARCGARIPVFTEAEEEGEPYHIDAIDHRCAEKDKLRKALDERGIEVLTDLDQAKKQARSEANRYDQYRYVVSVLDGYVVVGYADLCDYFGDEMEPETVYKVDVPGDDRGKYANNSFTH